MLALTASFFVAPWCPQSTTVAPKARESPSHHEESVSTLCYYWWFHSPTSGTFCSLRQLQKSIQFQKWRGNKSTKHNDLDTFWVCSDFFKKGRRKNETKKRNREKRMTPIDSKTQILHPNLEEHFGKDSEVWTHWRRRVWNQGGFSHFNRLALFPVCSLLPVCDETSVTGSWYHAFSLPHAS